jgi:Uma2 family endonuclease
MKAVLRLDQRATYADYLAVEQNSDRRHEFIDGVIVAMAGGSDEHNAIAVRLTILVGTRLKLPCRYYPADQRFWIPAHARGRYADGSIICGKPDHPPHDDQATTNPIVVFEVLSPSTEGDDDGDKRLDFQSLRELEAYVLAYQDRRCIKVHRRDVSGEWNKDPEVYGDGESFSLPRLLQPCAVDEVYHGVLDERGQSLLR